MLDVYSSHQADAAWAVDDGVFFTELFQLAFPVFAHRGGVFKQVLFAYSGNGGNASGTGDGVTAKGGTVISGYK